MSQPGHPPAPQVTVFISYAREDRALVEELERHLLPLQGEVNFSFFYDRGIPVGDDWRAVLLQRLRVADLVLLVMSENFLLSYFCTEVEMKLAMERHEERDAVVI